VKCDATIINYPIKYLLGQVGKGARVQSATRIGGQGFRDSEVQSATKIGGQGFKGIGPVKYVPLSLS